MIRAARPRLGAPAGRPDSEKVVSEFEPEELSFKQFRTVARKAVRLASAELVSAAPFDAARPFLHVVSPNVAGLNLASWALGNRADIEAQLLTHGALLFRDFGVEGAGQFEGFARAVSPELLDYKERAAPRREVSDKIFTSTEYPADQWIPLHHEMSYSHHWPTKIWFYCALPATGGGGTPVASDRRVFARIPAGIKDEFMRKKVLYVRNYGEGVDLPWQEVFQTTERAAVEDYFRRSDMRFEWLDGNRLRTYQRRQAVATHPRTGETVWFNHAHMFHVSNLEPAVSAALLEEFAPDELPRNAFYGDGAPIDSEVLDEIRAIYRDEAVTFPWRRGDVLMLDNFLCSHGREPFVGPRQILVAMAELYTNSEA